MIDLTLKKFSVNNLLRATSKVILFGAGGAGLDAAKFLKTKGIEVLFFCDNDVKKHGKSVQGVKIFPPEKLESYKDETVLISSEFAKEIGLQMRGSGVKKFYYFGYC